MLNIAVTEVLTTKYLCEIQKEALKKHRNEKGFLESTINRC